MALTTSSADSLPVNADTTDTRGLTQDFSFFQFTPVEDFLAEKPTNSPGPSRRKKKTNVSTPATVTASMSESPTATTAPPLPDEAGGALYASMEPLFLSSSITTTYVKDLYELCQSHVPLTPTFHFTTSDENPQLFSVRLKFVGGEELKEIDVPGLYPSKKHAKEAAAALAIDYVKSLPGRQMVTTPLPEAAEEDKHWVQDLNEYCIRKKSKPQYFDFATSGAGFSCEITLPQELELPGLEGKVFGDRHKAYRSKRSAKVMAAKEAMEWINQISPAPSETSIMSSKKNRVSVIAAGGTIFVPADMAASQAVNIICPKLGIMSPEYCLDPLPQMPGVYDVRAIVRRPNVSKPALVGPIRNVHGKKKAKEEIAASVLLFVKQVAKAKGIEIIEIHDLEET